MRRVTKIVAALLLLWEPLNVALEVLSVFPSLVHRGWVSALELFAHTGVAAVSAAAGVALWNAGPEARKLATAAIVLSLVRTIQSLYWSTLPRNTVPGDEPLIVLTAAVVSLIAASTLVRSGRRTRADVRTRGRADVRTC